jgi:hypothetical protein
VTISEVVLAAEENMTIRLASVLLLALLAGLAFFTLQQSFNSDSLDLTGRYIGAAQEDFEREQEARDRIREQEKAEAKQFAQEQTAIRPNESNEAHIERLIELLVYDDSKADNSPVIQPFVQMDGSSSESLESTKRFFRVYEAFEKLASYKAMAFEATVAHLGDQRKSLTFRNHYLANSVGDACYWNIYFQLQDRPEGYSRYGYQRQGRDGKSHVQPYYKGTPFSEYYKEGGAPHNDLTGWLEANKDLSYPQMQVKCLTWLLDEEKAIGAPDAESYFINILPLEIQILKRKIECGDKVEAELASLERRLKDKRADEIPPELLPTKTN